MMTTSGVHDYNIYITARITVSVGSVTYCPNGAVDGFFDALQFTQQAKSIINHNRILSLRNNKNLTDSFLMLGH
jgi:hypothetical protein